MTGPHGDGSTVTIREVYGLVQATKSEILSELGRVSAEWRSELAMHRSEHDRDQESRSSRTRWAVTTLLSGAGVLVAILIAVLT